MEKLIEQVIHNENVLAIIVRNSYQKEGISFFTPDDLSQQLAYMHHPKGKIIQPHVHNPLPRQIRYTQEVLFIKKGKLRVDFYSEDRTLLESRILEKGDVILLITGGHGFEVLEPLEMFEVKQGPYMGEADKTQFSGICLDKDHPPGKKEKD